MIVRTLGTTDPAAILPDDPTAPLRAILSNTGKIVKVAAGAMVLWLFIVARTRK